MSGARRSVIDLGIAALAIGVIAIALEIWTSAFRVPGYLMPAPSAVAARFASDIPFFLREASVTIVEAAAGFAVGTGVAFVIAAVMVRSRLLERTLFPLAILVKLTPIVAKVAGPITGSFLMPSRRCTTSPSACSLRAAHFQSPGKGLAAADRLFFWGQFINIF